MADAIEQPTYRVMATREDDAWLADVPELPGAHTFARTLPALDKAVREVIVLAADLPDAKNDLERRTARGGPDHPVQDVGPRQVGQPQPSVE